MHAPLRARMHVAVHAAPSAPSEQQQSKTIREGRERGGLMTKLQRKKERGIWREREVMIPRARTEISMLRTHDSE